MWEIPSKVRSMVSWLMLASLFCVLPATADVQSKPVTDDLQSNIEEALKEEGLTGAAWGFRDETGVVKFGSAGFRDAKNKIPFDADTRFHVGSVTKALLATGVLRVVSEGKISLDSPVKPYLPGFAFENPWQDTHPVTLRHLLDHSSGLNDARLWQMFSMKVMPDTPLVEAFTRQPEVMLIRARPGSRFSYSNMGYTLLAVILESLTGEPYERYLDRELLLPLGMKDSSFAFTTQQGDEADPRLAWGHIDDGSPYPAAAIMLRPAGQFTTTTADWMRFVEFLMGDGSIDGKVFIHPELMQGRGVATTTLAAQAGLESGYAFGLSRLDRYDSVGLCHSGNVVGFSALMCVYADSGQAFVISINTDSETANYQRIYEILATSLTHLELETPNRAVAAADAAEWHGYYILSPNRFEGFLYLDILFGFAKFSWHEGNLLFEPLQGASRTLVPTGDYLLSATDRQLNSHVLLRSKTGRSKTGGFLVGDGYRTYERISATLLFSLWLSLVLGAVGMLWLMMSGLVDLKRYGLAGFRQPAGIALIGVLGLFVSVPFFFLQPFMALGDLTIASFLLAASTVFLPLCSLIALWKTVRLQARSWMTTINLIALIAVLQWCAVLYNFEMLPFRLWA
jgi:CubicO group peptidase (beta-lactamase class C family)